MKIVSVVVFTTALIGSWMISRSQAPIPQSVHVGIQNDLKNIIGEYVEKNLPDARNLHFEKFWTEAVKKDKVKAVFVYTFENASDENPAVLRVEGSAILNKIAETPENVTWSMDELQIQDSHVDFQEPIHITALHGALESNPLNPPTPEQKEVQ